MPKAQAQRLDPTEVPQKIKFANLELELDDDARAAVQKKVNGLMRSSSFYNSFVDRCNVFFPVIEQVFEGASLPEDFKFLALQESALIADAVSRSDAVGFWQFKEATARELGLKVDKKIDERKNIKAASQAAAKYLKKNNYFMRNWVYSLLSYNLGLTGANSILDRSLIGAEKMSLDKDTHIYVIHFLAHKVAFENAVGRDNSKNRLALVEYPNSKGKKLKKIYKDTEVEIALLEKYNRWMEGDQVPTSTKMPPFYIPVKVKDRKELVAKLSKDSEKDGDDDPSSSEKSGDKDKEYKQKSKYPIITQKRKTEIGGQKVTFVQANGRDAVIPGEGTDMADLIGALDISRRRFMRFNDMDISSEMETNQPYYLQRKKRRTPTDAEFHTLQHGQDLWDVAQMYAMKLRLVRKKNRIDDNEEVEPGRVLWLKKRRPRRVNVEIKDIGPPPKKEENETAPAIVDVDQEKLEKILKIEGEEEEDQGPVMPITSNGRFHVVKKGETLFAISRAYRISTLRLRELNDLPENLELKEGQILIVRESVVKEPELSNDSLGSVLDNEVVRIDDEGNVIEGDAPEKPATKDKDSTRTGRRPSNGTPTVDEEANAAVHIVRPRENIYTIAKTYKISSDDIIRWNKLDPLRVLEIGQRLYVSNPNARPNEAASGSNTAGNGNSSPSTNRPAITREVAEKHTVEPGETLYGISRNYDIKVQDLIRWNQLNSNKPISVGQQLIVEDSAAVAATNNANQNDNNASSVYHKVESGDNLPTIAYRYGTTVEDIRRINNISSGDILVEGQILLVRKLDSDSKAQANTNSTPSSGSSLGSTSRGSSGKAPGAEAKMHVVKPGDTVYGLSRAYGIKPEQLREWNSLSSNSLSVGQKLMVGYESSPTPKRRDPAQNAPVETETSTQQTGPGKATSSNQGYYVGEQPQKVEKKPEKVYHTVKKGDTLYNIARRNDLSVNELKILNEGITTKLSIGQKVRVK
mgnify:CR=1 FL=1